MHLEETTALGAIEESPPTSPLSEDSALGVHLDPPHHAGPHHFPHGHPGTHPSPQPQVTTPFSPLSLLSFILPCPPYWNPSLPCPVSSFPSVFVPFAFSPFMYLASYSQAQVT